MSTPISPHTAPHWPWPSLMVQGCTSDAGKSSVVAGLCRLLYNHGLAVAPFKPQNMALNSAVTLEGGEIGRAQALQARAAGLRPHIDMNPILLKPSSDTGAQVIVHGHVREDMSARNYHNFKPQAMQAVVESFERLQKQYTNVIIEGAGSPAEINLRARDIANMGFAEKIDCPVILVADIDRGGVFAHLLGTLACLSDSERQRIKGFVINRFRGDPSLLQGGLDWIEQKTGVPVLAVLPFLSGLMLDAEDSLATEQRGGPFRIVVPVLPRIANHNDFDALRAHPDVEVCFVRPGAHKPPADLVILPGSKNTRNDLQFLQDQDWHTYLNKHIRYGGKVIGICGGYQMLGKTIEDPSGVEGKPGMSQGFALLDIHSTLQREKALVEVSGKLYNSNAAVCGYEIHMGTSDGPDRIRPACLIGDQPEGARSADDQVMGSYVHGIFDTPGAAHELLNWAGLNSEQHVDIQALREDSIERMAEACQPLFTRLQNL